MRDPELLDRIAKMATHLNNIKHRKPCGCDLSHCFECFCRIVIDRESNASTVVQMRRHGG
jgi:bacterioferritin-associated ferredoxin